MTQRLAVLQAMAEPHPAQDASATDSNVASDRSSDLPKGLQHGIHQLSGHSVADVRVHRNSPDPARMGAMAYAQGRDIHLGPGQEQHLPHEAWHVVQQSQGRVRPTTQLRAQAINDDTALEQEADQMGARAARLGSRAHSGETPQLQHKPGATGGDVLQAKMGFELEMLALVDINGRPPPEKTFLGSYGAQQLELQVDHNGQVAGPTPTAPQNANFSVATRLPTAANPNINAVTLGAYDLPQNYSTEVGADPTAAGPVADTRPALGMFDPAAWQAATNDATIYARPPNNNTTGLQNNRLLQIDNAITDYRRAHQNWEPTDAAAAMRTIVFSATSWLATNDMPPTWRLFRSNARRNRYRGARTMLGQLRTSAHHHRAFWTDPTNAAIPGGMARLFQPDPTAANPAPPVETEHPIAGAGTSRYASILEIVTRPYETETPAGRADLVTAMTEAVALATAVEGATNNFANRAPLNGMANANILRPNTHVGNDNVPYQNTDASIQSTFAIDLTQIGALMNSTIAFSSPQAHFGLQHQADTLPLGAGGVTVNRAQVEMALAVNSATQVVNNMKAQIGGGAPSFVNMRGLLILMCQYLRLGKHWAVGNNPLDKNLTDLLSRTDLSHIYQRLVPPAERVWIEASAANRNMVIGWLMGVCGRAGGTRLMNNPAENYAAPVPPYMATTCNTFADNVFTQATDGITANFGGFQQRPDESIDPGGGTRGGDTRPAGEPERMAAVFEMRNMVPKLGDNIRFPKADWVPLATYLSEAVHLLNQRNEAASVADIKARDTPGGVVATPPAPAW
ncbi:MAG: DUF4157 domain-containing protein [Paracoccaceae bacterium]|nr:DUF4157 domain-containing protein [Paracoccaceae bacterium]